MSKRESIAVAVIMAVSIWEMSLFNCAMAQSLDEQIDSRLQQRLVLANGSSAFMAAGLSIHEPGRLARFYTQRQYRAAWQGNDGLPLQVASLIQVLREAYEEGFDPREYHLAAIETLTEELYASSQTSQGEWNADRYADLDLLLSDAFLMYGTHLLTGRLRLGVGEVSQVTTEAGDDLVAILQKALESGDVRAALRGLLPTQTGYADLRQALARYRQIATNGGWPTVPEGPALRKGDADARILAVRRRLQVTGDVGDTPAASAVRQVGIIDTFDEELEQAVRAFQARHGLTIDGIVGEATLAALNVPATVRVGQIALNMERWRWLSHQLGARYIQVNIPAFRLDVMEHEASVLSMRVVVGKPDQRTPVFSGTMTYLVLNPSWKVPASIARREILPILRQKPDYLANRNITVLQASTSGLQAIDPLTINWSMVTASDFRYRLRQEPGPQNALGRVKFIFPNPYHVYLHDTPSRSSFDRPMRAFSHGCVRLEDPVALAEYLLQEEPRWSRESILDMIERGHRRHLSLRESIPVHLIYRTAWVDAQGAMQFRPDIYQLDQRHATAFCDATRCE